MEFMKMGCGCVYLVLDDHLLNLADRRGRLIEPCDGEWDGGYPFIGEERPVTERVMEHNIKTANSLTAEETARLLSRLNDLVTDGHRWRALKRAFDPIVRNS